MEEQEEEKKGRRVIETDTSAEADWVGFGQLSTNSTLSRRSMEF